MAEHVQRRWLLTGDLHVGARTAPTMNPEEPEQVKMLACWRNAIEWFGPPPDVVLVNGDSIDGEDKKGKDNRNPNLFEQAEDAAALLHMWGATSEYIIITGSGYHEDADGHQFSRAVVDKLTILCEQAANGKTRDAVKVSWHQKMTTTVNGWFRLSARHKIGRSSVPYGATTPQARSKMWNVLNEAIRSDEDDKPAKWPHLLVFSHVHYRNYHEDDFGAVCSLPCWQDIGTRFGNEQCDGHISLGCARLTVEAVKEEGWCMDWKTYQPGSGTRVEHR